MDSKTSLGDDNSSNGTSKAEKCEQSESPTSSHQNKDQPPKNINPRLWEKYQSLKQKREAITKRSEQRRIMKESKVKKTADAEESIPDASKITETSDQQTSRSEEVGQSAEKKWEAVQNYMHCNDHIKGVEKGKYAEKGEIEEKIESALKRQDYETAEKLSDKIAQNEFGKVITEAIDAKTFTEKRKMEEETKIAKKKKKLAWGFDHKERWETKSNM